MLNAKIYLLVWCLVIMIYGIKPKIFEFLWPKVSPLVWTCVCARAKSFNIFEGKERKKKKEKKSVKTMVSYTYNRHHMWRTQTAWTKKPVQSMMIYFVETKFI